MTPELADTATATANTVMIHHGGIPAWFYGFLVLWSIIGMGCRVIIELELNYPGNDEMNFRQKLFVNLICGPVVCFGWIVKSTFFSIYYRLK